MSQTTNQVMETGDFLEHYGVKGMKWGHRKKSSQIHAARSRMRTARAKIRVVEDKRDRMPMSSKERKQADKEVSKMRTEYLKNPDRAAAARMTAGEAIVLTILTGPIGIGAFAGTHARSTHINSRQQAGEYGKKKK